MSGSLNFVARRMADPFQIGLAALAICGATILVALGFEHIGGYEPCALCLKERIPYYAGLPVVVVGLLALRFGWPRSLAATIFAAFAIISGIGAGLGIYHAGAEWGFWPGPATCGAAGAGPADAAAMLQSLQRPSVGPSCTEATWRMLGLSFAGWNAVIAAVLCLAGLRAAALIWTSRRRVS